MRARIHISPSRPFCEGSSTPGPNHNVAFPNLFRCGDGSLLLVHRVGSQKNSAVGELWLWRSRDEGASWAREPFASRTPSGKSADFRPSTISDIGNGQLAMILTWIEHPDDSPLLVNPKTEGLLPVQIGWTISSDHGETWSAPREISVAPLVQPAGNGPILRLSNGDLLVPFETYKHFDDPSPWSANTAIAISRDNGKTWTARNIVADPERQVSYFDPHVYLTREGALLAFLWTDDRRKPGASEIFWTRSAELGRTWSAAAPTGLSGQYSSTLALPDGRWLMLYVVRHGDSAIRIALGSPDGTKWQTQDDVALYSQRANDLARSAGKDFGDYLLHMGQWTFGWPSMIPLRDGSILAAYYSGAGDRSSIYLARIEVGPGSSAS